MDEEMEQDAGVVTNGFLAAVCLAFALAAAFIFATWAVSCTAHAYPPPPWTPIGWSEKFPPPRPEGWVDPTSWEGSITGTGTVEGLVEGLAEAASTGDVDITWNVGTDTIATPADHQVLTFQLPPKDGQVLMYDGGMLKWVYPTKPEEEPTASGIVFPAWPERYPNYKYYGGSSGVWADTEPETKEKGGIMFITFDAGFGASVIFFGAIALMVFVYIAGRVAKQWVNDEPVCVELLAGDGIDHPVQLFVVLLLGVLAVLVLSLAWPVAYPVLVIIGILFGVRMIKRVRKSIKNKSDVGHTHDE